MNVYAINTDNEVMVWGETDIDPAEYDLIYEVVAAKTPGQARSIITCQYGLDYLTPMHVRKLADDIDLPSGAVYYWHGQLSTALLVQAAVVWYDMDSAEEFYQWQGWQESLAQYDGENDDTLDTPQDGDQ